MENKFIKKCKISTTVPIEIEITQKDIIEFIRNCYDLNCLREIKHEAYVAAVFLEKYGQPYPPDDDDDFRSRA